MSMKENGTGATEQRLVDANEDVGNEVTKIKTHHARIVVDGTADKPYYSIEWYDTAKKVYYLGYSSYNIELVFNWLSECFEIVDAPTVDAVEVVRCRECEHYVKLLGEDRRRCSIFSGCYDRPYPTEPEDFCSYGVRQGSAYEK